MSLLDQFERGESYYRGPSQMERFDQLLEQYGEGMGRPGSASNESDLFNMTLVEYKPKGLKHMMVCNDVVVMALDNCHLIRLRLEAADELEDIDLTGLTKKMDAIHKIFLDPTGSHLIIAMESKDNWYLHASWAKPKMLSKMKGVLIESVAWDTQNSDRSTTNEILIGLKDGRIFSTIIEAKEKLFLEGKEKFFKVVCNLNTHAGEGSSMAVTGLHFERFPPTATEPSKYFVMATTTTKIYQFIGGPTFDAVFSTYEVNPTADLPEMPGEEFQHSELCFFSKYMGLPKSFAWLTRPGIFHGNLVFGSQNPGDSVMVDSHLLPHPVDNRAKQTSVRGATTGPVSLAQTEFHFLLLYEDRICAISSLNNQVVWEESLGRGAAGSRLRGLASDVSKGNIWCYAEDAIYLVSPNNEDRNVWKLYLEKFLFEEALQHCKDASQRDVVWTAQADNYFSKGNFGLAAEYYGKTSKSFEEIALKFIDENERDALKTYLMAKLRSLGAKDLTQKTMICTWVTELYLNKLNQLKNSHLDDQHEMLQEEFSQFLADNLDHLDKATTINLIQSHGRGDELLCYCALIEDWERVIEYHFQHSSWDRAIAVMSKLTSSDMYYKFSPTLMEHIPFLTVNAWISSKAPLNPRKLIPALMRYQHPLGSTEPHQAIRYLEYCITKLQNEDPAIHNYLLSLYAAVSDDNSLIGFIKSKAGRFDLKYALRLCTKHNKQTACILIYSAMGLYEEAVDLALKVDIELAMQNADMPEDEDLRKKLWLRVARHVVEERKDIRQAMEFLHCTELLKIEDILPFFPDFVLIDDFKEQICLALEGYNKNIDKLKEDMNDATNSADFIRDDIKNLRNRYGFVPANQKCAICGFPALTRAFYLFPCQHVFHTDCLKREVRQYLTGKETQRVRELESEIGRLAAISAEKAAHGHRALPSERDGGIVALSADAELKNELDGLIAAECLNCGDKMIDSISRPFIDERDEAEFKSWYV